METNEGFCEHCKKRVRFYIAGDTRQRCENCNKLMPGESDRVPPDEVNATCSRCEKFVVAYFATDNLYRCPECYTPVHFGRLPGLTCRDATTRR